MTYLQMYKAFTRFCPLKSVKDWRPFGKNTICVWLTGSRTFECLKVTVVNSKKYVVEACHEDEWLKFYDRNATILSNVKEVTHNQVWEGEKIFQ